VAPLLLALRCALDPDRLDEEAAVALLHSPLGGADPLSERRLRQGLRALALAGGDRRPSGVLLVEALLEPAELVAVDRRWARPAQAVARLLEVIRHAAGTGKAPGGPTAEDVLWALWQASGLAERWAAASARGGYRGAAADRDLDAVMVLFDAAARFVDRLPGARIEVFLDHVEGQQLPADTLARTADRGSAVRLLTAHAAKGQEWDVVAVAGVQEGVWPDLRLRGSVLGAEQLVDLVSGKAVVPAVDPGVQAVGVVVQTVSQTSALLAEERRLFSVAVTRARQRLVVTAVHSGDGEEQPSRFLHELEGGDAATREPVATRLPRALTLPALVAELRQVAATVDESPARRRAAAGQLAKLAAAGVPGADPELWWGLNPLSDDRPLVDADGVVTVSPSTVESVQRCSLRWLLERHGGGGTRSPEQSVGDLVHEIAQQATDPGARDELVSYLDSEFGKIELSARWLAGPQRRRAEQMIDKLVAWLAANPRRLAAIERDFAVHVDEGVRIKGRVDRLEVDDQGRLVVIDLKTGSVTPSASEMAEYPQLGAYQAAVEAGAFPELGSEPGGAALVQLGTDHVGVKEQSQPPLADAEDPTWAASMVRRTAAAMAASTFSAVVNNRCRNCPVRHSCPISGKGRQVHGEGGA
jgi:RecB family exonuclease